MECSTAGIFDGVLTACSMDGIFSSMFDGMFDGMSDGMFDGMFDGMNSCLPFSRCALLFAYAPQPWNLDEGDHIDGHRW